ncbi:TCR gamma alternate reading frame protein [Grus japonensis]
MLLLPLLALAAAWSYGQAQVLLKQSQPSITRGQDGFAQEIPMQSPISITKAKGTARLYCHVKDVSEDFGGLVIHWYQQKEDGYAQEIPMQSPISITKAKGSVRLECDFKYVSQNFDGLVIHWYQQKEDKGNSAPENAEVLRKQHGDQITYVCLIEKFYPDVIRVTWNDGEKEVTDNVVKGDAWKATEDDKYSISSWLTVPAENKDKKYLCKYEHEGKQDSKQAYGIY